MMDFATIASIVTVVAVLAYAGIVVWTLSRRQTARFEAAAQLPFALPDEVSEPAAGPAGKAAQP